MKVKAAAKINLALDVTGKLKNGYHTIESVFQTVSLYDEVTVELADSISIECELPESFEKADPIPCDERNIAFKAAKKFFEAANIDSGCRIHIKKGIPSQAGMGGGSTDAAAVIYCLNELTKAAMTSGQLEEIGAKIGADVPFFFTGGTAYVSGIGEKIVPIADYSGRILVIAKGTHGVSTAEAYGAVDALNEPVHPKVSSLKNAIENEPNEAYKYFGNLFEDAIKLDEVDQIKIVMNQNGALNSVMTGSGSAVFGIFSDSEQAEICRQKLSELSFFAVVCQTIS